MMKKKLLQIGISTTFAATLFFGQVARADPEIIPELILGGNQVIDQDTDTDVVIVGKSVSDNHVLTVQDGATLTNVGSPDTVTGTIDGESYSGGNGYLGFNKNSAGTAIVTGEDSLWDNSGGDLFVGYQGQGTLTVEKGGAVSSENGFVGAQSDSNGVATVTGVGSQWDNMNLYVGGVATGAADQGELTINDKGTVPVFENATIWSTGKLSGNGGTLDGDVINYGVISPGNAVDSVGVLTITGDLELKDTGILDLGISSPTLYDQLVIDGDFTIAGSLILDFTDFSQPTFATTYDLIQVNDTPWGSWSDFNIQYRNPFSGFDSSLLSYSMVGSEETAGGHIFRLTIAGAENTGHPIPEPASMLLVGLGGVIMLLSRRRLRSAG